MAELTRPALAEAFLTEAVFRSRARQAAGSALLGARLDAPAGPGTCGLGEKAAVDLDLSERGAELFRALWPAAPPAAELERIDALLADWVRRNDALDRKRNHFLKDFRREHGADRRAWSPALLEQYESGLAAINAEVQNGLTAAARALLAPAQA